MPTPGNLTLTTVNLNASDPGRLARFYARLLDWPIRVEEPDWVLMRAEDADVGLSFQAEDKYVPPTWPATDGAPQMQIHLEIRVDDLAAAEAHAQACGAVRARYQPQDDVRVYLDPDGHPFCLWLGE